MNKVRLQNQCEPRTTVPGAKHTGKCRSKYDRRPDGVYSIIFSLVELSRKCWLWIRASIDQIEEIHKHKHQRYHVWTYTYCDGKSKLREAEDFS
jgi:hypothetical protein